MFLVRCTDHRPPLLCLLHLERLLRSPFVDQRGEDGSGIHGDGWSGWLDHVTMDDVTLSKG